MVENLTTRSDWAIGTGPPEDEIVPIATLDTGASIFFDHRDPQMTARLGSVWVS